MNKINWNNIFNEVTAKQLNSFCGGNITRRDFESMGTECRKAVRVCGSKDFKSRARKAISARS